MYFIFNLNCVVNGLWIFINVLFIFKNYFFKFFFFWFYLNFLYKSADIYGDLCPYGERGSITRIAMEIGDKILNRDEGQGHVSIPMGTHCHPYLHAR